MFNIKDIGFEKATENVDVKEVRIKSTELVELVNEFRELEGEMTGRKVANLRHNDFMAKIRKELQVLEVLNSSNERNISLVEYVDAKGESRPCYSLSKNDYEKS